nr:MAG: hypothetical protein [Lokiarchaeota virus Skoll Meg22_1214]
MNEIEVKPMIKFTDYGYKEVKIKGDDVIYIEVYRRCSNQCYYPLEGECDRCIYRLKEEQFPHVLRKEYFFKNMRRNFFIWYFFNERL